MLWIDVNGVKLDLQAELGLLWPLWSARQVSRAFEYVVVFLVGAYIAIAKDGSGKQSCSEGYINAELQSPLSPSHSYALW